MKFFVVFAVIFAVAMSAAGQDSQQAEIVRYDNNNIGVYGYQFAVETSDGKTHSEQGVLNNVGTDQESLAVRGQYSYVGPDGVTYSLTYTADEGGFQPNGDHIPRRE